jgi:hypothetical protein
MGTTLGRQQRTEPGDAMKPDVELHVEELVLHGFARRDRAAIGDALRGELARLIAEGGVPAGLGAADGAASLDGGSFRASPGQRPAQVGAAVARAIYGSGRP